MDGDLKDNVTRRSTWLRFCFMIMMGVAFSVAEVVVFAVVVFQFLLSLFTGKTNDQLVRLGRNLARYLQQVTAYLTYATEDVPFPFMSWPDEPHEERTEADRDQKADEPEEEPEEDDEDDDEDEKDEDDNKEEDETLDKKDDLPPQTSAPSTPAAPSVAAPLAAPGQGAPIKADRAEQEAQEASKEAAEEKPGAPADEPVAAVDAAVDDVKSVESTDDDHRSRNQPEAPADDGEDEAPPAGKPAQAEAAAETVVFADGDAYQKFMGERSRLSGLQFVGLLDLPPRLSWLDVGCGTGAFSAVILENCDPVALIGIDRSAEQVSVAQAELGSSHASFRVGDATRLPFEADSFDVAVSSYVLNFVPEKQRMVDEMARVVRPEGIVAISVFDHAGGRNASHPVWQLIGRRDPAFRQVEFVKRGWNITNPDALTTFFRDAGLEEVFVESIEIDETFADFDDYWNRMTSLSTSALSLFLDGLDDSERAKFRDELKELVPTEPDGGITIKTASWVVRGKVPA